MSKSAPPTDPATPRRKHPNIALTGTPCVGKTSLARALVSRVPSLHLLDLSAAAETHSARIAYDDALSTWEIDEELLASRLTPALERDGGAVLDWMHADFWDEGLLDLVVTLRADNGVLWRRYEARGYADAKVQENIDAEVMGVIAEENRECFGGVEGLLREWQSETQEQEADNLESLVRWVAEWEAEREEVGPGESEGSSERQVAAAAAADVSSGPNGLGVKGRPEERPTEDEGEAPDGDTMDEPKKSPGPIRKLAQQLKAKGTTSKTDSPQLKESEASLKDLLT